jgi:hypothetical protein
MDCTLELLDRLIPLTRDDHPRSQVSIGAGRHWIGFLLQAGLLKALCTAQHRGQKPRIVSTGFTILRIDCKGAFEVSFGRGIAPLIPLLFDGEGNVCFDIRLVERKSSCRRFPCARPGDPGVDRPAILVDEVAGELAIGLAVDGSRAIAWLR